MNELYFDYNATTPIHKRVFEAMRPYLTEQFGNPGSGHSRGQAAKQAVEKAREQVATLIDAAPEEILFTSCATESNNLALFGTFGPNHESRAGRLVTSAIEHPAILGPAIELDIRGVDVRVVGVGSSGLVSPKAVIAACSAPMDSETNGPKLVSIMLANNETGVLQPVADIARKARALGFLVHTDAAQAVAKIPVNVKSLNVDFLTIAGHKIYAPKGIGALYVRANTPLSPLFYGGGQERTIRPGTENVPYVVGLGEACAMATEDLQQEIKRQQELGALLLRGLAALGLDYAVHGGNTLRLPTTLNIGFKGVAANKLIDSFTKQGIAVSAGAACHSGETKLSPVLEAMDVDKEYAAGAVRFSWGRLTTHEDVKELVRRMSDAFDALPE